MLQSYMTLGQNLCICPFAIYGHNVVGKPLSCQWVDTFWNDASSESDYIGVVVYVVFGETTMTWVISVPNKKGKSLEILHTVRNAQALYNAQAKKSEGEIDGRRGRPQVAHTAILRQSSPPFSQSRAPVLHLWGQGLGG